MNQANLDFSLHVKKTRKCEFLEQCFTFSQLGMKEVLFDVSLYRKFSQIPGFSRMPEESTIFRFRHRLKKFKLSDQLLATVNDSECPYVKRGQDQML
eukprot:gene34800-45012_t